jgi:hypothetical protein
MIKFLRSLFWSDKRDLEPMQPMNNGAENRKLEMDEPMAGAGALISGEHHMSDGEKSLARAAEQNSR